MQLDRRGAELLFQVLTERAEASLASAPACDDSGGRELEHAIRAEPTETPVNGYTTEGWASCS
jgi:hypothetical protein